MLPDEDIKVIREPRFFVQGVKQKGEVYESVTPQMLHCLQDAEHAAREALSRYACTRVLKEEVVFLRKQE